MASDFTRYRRTQVSELRPYVAGEALERVSVSAADAEAGSPKIGDMIARNPENHDDQWLVAAEYFRANFEPLDHADGADAQALEGALSLTERQRDEARAQVATLTAERNRLDMRQRAEVKAHSRTGLRLDDARSEAGIERARALQAEAERDRARAAGRRLADYWRVQAEGAEALHERVMTHWRSALGSALGLEMPLLSEILEALDGEGASNGE